MPAQEFYIEAAGKYGKSDWFSLSGFSDYLRENLNFGEPVFRRYKTLKFVVPPSGGEA